MQRDDVGAPDEIVHIVDARHAVLLGEFLIPVEIETEHLHPESPGAGGNLFADAPETGDADRLAHQLVAGEAFPLPVAHRVRLLDDVAINGEEQSEGVLGHGGVVDSGTESDGQLQFGRRRDVDLVESDAVFGHDLEAREGFLQDGARDSVIAAKERIEVPGQFEHARFVERAALSDDFVAFLRQQFVVRTGRVLERCGGEKNFGHVKKRHLRPTVAGLPVGSLAHRRRLSKETSVARP